MRCLPLSNRFMQAATRSLGRHLFSAFSATHSRRWSSVITSATRGPVVCCGSLQHQVAATGSMANNNGQKVVSRTDLYKGKFLKLTKVEYTRPGSDQLFPWEAAERTTTSRAGVDAVAVLALVLRSGERPQVVIVKQFRPPTSKHTIELPAGLIDEGETPETAALRELKEETGYSGTVLAVTGVQYQSPGLTNECIQTVLVKVDGDAAENKHPPQMLEESEFIDVELMPLDNMTESLKKFEEQGYGVFTGLSSLALGLQLPILLSGMGL